MTPSGPEDATALAARVRAGETSAAAAVTAALARLERRDPAVRSFAAVDAAGALARAEALDRELARGTARPLPLAGVPVALKANLCLADRPCDCGSAILAGWRAPYTATAVERLLAAGAIPIGTTRMDEFAMGSSGENGPGEHARNPWDTARAPGGSSSGSAAATAAGIVPLALGSDTGGSVRQPAALCGVSGFKPTYGRVSRHGLVAFGSSLDQVSPLATSARDLELALGVMAGRDPRDPTTLDEPFTPAPPAADGRPLEGKVVGVARRQLEAEGVAPEVRARVEEALDVLRALGATVRPVELPLLDLALAVYYVVATAEASSNLARFDGVRYGLRAEGDGSLQGMIARTRGAGFGDEVKRRILLGTFVLSAGYQEAWYGRAQAVRRALAQEHARAFQSVDLLAGPTSPTVAFRLGERTRDPLAMYASDVLTVPASLAGLPAASVPCGLVEEDGVRLPVGLQLAGPRGADARVLAAARAFQAATDHHAERAPCAREEA